MNESSIAIMVNIAGTDVPVSLTDEQISGIRKEVKTTFALSIVEQYIKKAQEVLGVELDPHEEEEILEDCSFPENQSKEEFISDIITGVMFDAVKHEVQEAVDRRKKFYVVTIRATQEFDIVVKAQSAEEAEEYASNLDYHDLSDYLDDYDHEFEVIDTDTRGVNIIGTDDFFDADDQ